MAYAVYTVVYSSIHGNCYKLSTVNSSLIICEFFTPHLIMGQVFYGTDP